MKWYICFVAESMPGDSFFSQIKEACLFSYKEKAREYYGRGEDRIVCIYVLDCARNSHAARSGQKKTENQRQINQRQINQSKKPNGKCGKNADRTSWIAAKILEVKRRRFVERLATANEMLPNTYFLSDMQKRPQPVYIFCISQFLEAVHYEKNTVIGLIDGALVSYKIWIGLLREKLDRINALMIVSDHPESFVELYRDAWEEQGLVITCTGNYKELAFCDYVIDCSADGLPDKITFRKNCRYLMLSGQRKKKRHLFLQNQHIRISDCSNFMEKEGKDTTI